MYVTVTPQKNIEGGASALVQYLEKENKYSNGREMFFSSEADAVKPSEVVESLENNVKKLRLKKNETQFYNVLVAPSQNELEHINNDPAKLKEYVRGVMQEYAKGFNRVNKDGTLLTDKDMVWYAKLERERTFGGNDERVLHNQKYQSLKKSYDSCREIESKYFKHMPIEKRMSTEFKEAMDNMKGVYVKDKQGNISLKSEIGQGDKIIKRGMVNSGDCQSHIHIIVSRSHKTERMSLSPMANNRGGKNILKEKEVSIGFNRAQFSKNCEALFDLKYDYKRKFEHSTSFKLSKTKGIDIYNQRIAEKVVQGMFKGAKMQGYNQVNKAIYDHLVKDDTKVIDKLLKQTYPDNVLKSLEHKALSVGGMDVYGMFNAVNLPAKVAIEATKTVISAVSKGWYIGV